MNDKRFADGSADKEPACNAGDAREEGSIPGLGRSPGGGNGNPLQCSCLTNPMNRGAWWVTVPGVTKNQTRLSDWEHKWAIKGSRKAMWLSQGYSKGANLRADCRSRPGSWVWIFLYQFFSLVEMAEHLKCTVFCANSEILMFQSITLTSCIFAIWKNKSMPL